MIGLLRFLLRLFFSVTVHGDSNSFKQDKLLITPNHVSFLDGLLVGLFLPIKPVFVIHSDYQNNILVKCLHRYVELVYIDPHNPYGMKTLIKEVNKGRPIVIFPEGRITVTGSMMKIYDGAAFLAAKTGATIIPIWIDNAQYSPFSRINSLFRGRIFPRIFFPRISLHIGKQSKIAMPEIKKAAQRREVVAEKLYHIMQETRMMTRTSKTIFAALLESAKCCGWRRKVLEDVSHTQDNYRQLVKKSLAISRILREITQPDEHIGFLLPNASISAATIFAASLSGRIPALLNYTAGVNGIANAVKAAEIKTIITSRQFLEKGKLTHLVDGVKQVRWYYLEDLKDNLLLSDKLWVLFHQYLPSLAMEPKNPSDKALILFTSGSEGAAKGVVHSHRSLLMNVEQIRTVIDVRVDDKFMSALPLFHAFGLTAGLLLPLMCGSRTFLYPSPLHYRAIPELIYDRECTVLFGTPTILANYARYGHGYDMRRLRYVIAGAEKLTESTREQWMDKFGIRILEGYGVTECAPVIAVNTMMAYRKGTVGQILPGMIARIIPLAGINQGGRLQVSGPNLMLGYLRVENPGKLEAVAAENEQGELEAGWYDTGDIVTIDQHGFCTIQGRVKRFAKIAGEMISLEVVEKMVKQISPQFEHAVISKADPAKGEKLMLFTTDKTLTRGKLVQAAKTSGLPALAVPSEINHLKELPLLGTGKTDLVELKKIAEEMGK